ncbi:MAG: glycosyltransferase family 4 protein [Leptospirillum sp.]
MTTAPWVMTIKLDLENVHLIKDVGMIPYYIAQWYGLTPVILSHPHAGGIGAYPYLESEVRGLNLEFIKPTNRSFLHAKWEVVRFLWRHAKSIRILNLIAFSKESLMYSLVYKLRNPRGISYLKCDSDLGIIRMDYLRNPLKRNIHRFLFRSVTFYSVESTTVYRELLKLYPDIFKERLIYLPNGFPQKDLEISIDWGKKERIILFVGRVGNYQKATDVLVESFLSLDPSPWRLVLVGPVEPDFQEFLEEKSREFHGRLQYVGNIDDRKKLFEWYRRASVFCFPSRFESFGIAMLEAAMFGCFLILSDLPAAEDVTEGWMLGEKVIPGDKEDLTRALKKVTHPDFEKERQRLADSQMHYVRNRYTWETLVSKIGERLS